MSENRIWDLDEKCWKGYEKKGMKKMFGKMYPNCVKKEGVQTNTSIGENEIYWESNTGIMVDSLLNFSTKIYFEYQGRKVKLGKIIWKGDIKSLKYM